ncbi:MAG: ADP-ribosylglycohydrolase family protein, partial [Atopobium sp.]|nr:ADP-ribosylglycohydrolase family protein [Atopobium sp.]
MSNMNAARKIKLYRMLTALAYGDAYGMPTEMMSPRQIDFAFPDGIQSLSSPPKNDFFGRPFTAGQTTDDTANAIILTKNIIDNRGIFNQSRYFDALENYVATEPNAAQVVGPSTRAALANRLSGHSLKTCGRLGTTNGCAMK